MRFTITMPNTTCARSTLLVAGLLGGIVVGAAAGQRKPTLKHEYVTANGVRLHQVTAGEGRLILFLHGFPEFWYAWKDQLTEFSRDHLAVAPDLRGFNLSEKPPSVEQYRFADYLEDIRALAERFSPNRRFVLVGHDIGGALSWRFAMAHPDRLERLVIINAPHPGVIARLYQTDPAQQKATQYIVMFQGTGWA